MTFRMIILLIPWVVTCLGNQMYGMGIFQAISSGSVENCRIMLTADPSLLNARDSNGFTPLQKATFLGVPALVNLCLSMGAPVNQLTADGSTPLHCAAYGERRNAASLSDIIKTVEILMAHGADMDIRNNAGQRPSDLCFFPFTSSVCLLLQNYGRRIDNALSQKKIIGSVLARATHERLGERSPLSLLSQFTLKEITELAAENELYAAYQPQESMHSKIATHRHVCIIGIFMLTVTVVIILPLSLMFLCSYKSCRLS